MMTASPRPNCPLTLFTPAGSRLLPDLQRRARAVVDDDHALGLKRARDPALARRNRVGRREEPGAGRALAQAP